MLGFTSECNVIANRKDEMPRANYGNTLFKRCLNIVFDERILLIFSCMEYRIEVLLC